MNKKKGGEKIGEGANGKRAHFYPHPNREIPLVNLLDVGILLEEQMRFRRQSCALVYRLQC